ncbi:MAG: DUF2059 domain-containing protein [Parachlamydiales bacterium]|nr:DUF2059 domain-containing protein [Parachlamydiales bacterium]
MITHSAKKLAKICIFSTILLFGNVEAAEESTKQADIMELIRLSALNPEQVDQMLTQMVQVALASTKTEAESQKAIAEIKEQMLSDDFIKKFIPAFDKNFTHEEIKTLVYFYKNDAVKKLFKTGAETFMPIYAGMNELISKYAQASLPADQVIMITSDNFQKEVKDYKGTVILEAYSITCGPCKAMAPIFSSLSDEISGVKFCKLDIGTEFQIAQELQIQSVPTILFIKDGKVKDRHIGLVSKDDLKKKIEHNCPNLG